MTSHFSSTNSKNMEGKNEKEEMNLHMLPKLYSITKKMHALVLCLWFLSSFFLDDCSNLKEFLDGYSESLLLFSCRLKRIVMQQTCGQEKIQSQKRNVGTEKITSGIVTFVLQILSQGNQDLLKVYASVFFKIDVHSFDAFVLFFFCGQFLLCEYFC